MTVSRHWVTCLSAALALGSSAAALANSEQDAFRARFGDRVKLNVSTETGYVQDVLGRALDLGFRPKSDEDFAEIGRSFIDRFSGLFGVTGAELSEGEVLHHELAKIDSTDKVSVEYTQLAGSMTVKDASVCVLFDLDGRILSVQNQTVPGAYAVDQMASVGGNRALTIATEAFGHPVSEVRGNELAIIGHEGRALLVYLVELRSNDNYNGAPVQERITVDAQTGVVVDRVSSVHFTDLTGNVKGWASPGILPDKSGNAEQSFNLDYVRVDSPIGDADTDQSGNFTITYAGGTPQSTIVDFGSDNQRAYVLNDSGAELTQTLTITPGIPAQFELNTVKDEAGTAQVNAQRWILFQYRYVKNVDSSDTKVNFKALAHTMINSSCNAYYDGSSVNFYKKGSGCENFSYSTIVDHELGHWYNDKYGSGNGADGFGEGAADCWSMYVADDPYVGKDCCGAGSYIRYGGNTKKYDGSCGGSCSEVHECGKVLMGAIWKVRDKLNQTYGDAAGDAIADNLFVKWYQNYNDKTICATIEDHWLTIDDTDGNIFNGTPHYTEIDAAFRQQGFPGVDLQSDCTTPINYGNGTAGSFGLVPHIESINDPQIGSTNFTIRGENTLTGTSGFLFIGFAKATIFFGSTLILVDIVGPHITIPITTLGTGLPGGGYIEVLGPIPNDIGLDNLHFYSQYLFADGAVSSGFSATEGLDTTICCGC